jgi:glycine hydroxymethyltransferase
VHEEVRRVVERKDLQEALRYATVHLEAQSKFMDREALVLEAATSVCNPQALGFLSSSLAVRPSLGLPGDKYETGLAGAERVEALSAQLLTLLFGCKHAELRPLSGSQAVMLALAALVKPGDCVMSLPPTAGGHVSHRPAGAAGLLGCSVVDVPLHADSVQIDVDALAARAREVRPRVIMLGSSLPLFLFPVADVRRLADQLGGVAVLYDAAHVSGIIAGGRFQNPLEEGAHVVTSSSYKSFSGPPGGFVLTNQDDLAQRLERVAFPGLTANFNTARSMAMAVATCDLIQFGRYFAQACLLNAATLSAELRERGFAVLTKRDAPASAPIHTQSHILAFSAREFGGGHAAAQALEAAGILASSIGIPGPPGDAQGLRLGVQELTKRGAKPPHMKTVAEWLHRALHSPDSAPALRSEIASFVRSTLRAHSEPLFCM